MQEAYIVFEGIVQGVGFRYTSCRLASLHKIGGWVRNRLDGKVEMVVQGKKEEILSFLEDLKDEFKGYIHNYQIDWRSPSQIFSDFSIRF